MLFKRKKLTISDLDPDQNDWRRRVLNLADDAVNN
jgi:hypothetical protein